MLILAITYFGTRFNLYFTRLIYSTVARDVTVTIIPSSDQIYVKNGGCLRLKCETNREADIAWSKVEGEIR